jgi:hypothetical protein
MNSLANVFDLFTNEFTCLRARRFPFRLVVPGTLECPLLGHDGLLSGPHICHEGKSHRPCQFLRLRGKSLPSLPHRVHVVSANLAAWKVMFTHRSVRLTWHALRFSPNNIVSSQFGLQ